MKPNYNEKLRHNEWCNRLLNLSFFFVLLALLVEVVAFIIQHFILHMLDDVLHYLFYFLLMPSMINLLFFFAMYLISQPLLRKNKHGAQSLVFMIGTALICLNIAWAHRDIVIVSAVFCIPVFMALVYVKPKPLLIAFLLNTGMYLISLLLYWVDQQPGFSAPFIIGVVTALAFITASYLIASSILNRQLELLDAVRTAYHQTRLDSFTGLYNHSAFYDALDQYILDYKKNRTQFCLIILDIDNFKRINDQFGHDVGDDVILALVSAINAFLDQHDDAFRYGGEEFTILTRRDIRYSARLADNIRKLFQHNMEQSAHRMTVTASAGVSFYSGDRFSGKREYFATADEALYAAKRSGKDKTVIWTEELTRYPE